MEAANTKIRLITRRAYGFHSADALIALAMLTLGGLCPPFLVDPLRNGPTETTGAPRKQVRPVTGTSGHP